MRLTRSAGARAGILKEARGASNSELKEADSGAADPGLLETRAPAACRRARVEQNKLGSGK